MPFRSLHRKLVLLLMTIMISMPADSQNIDHWEMLVLNTDTWQYSLGNNSIPSNWNDLSFEAESWQQGPGGFGYGDGDDNTIINNSISVYIRREFNITDLNNIADLLFHIDYDDGYVAYLNGVEIARANIGSGPTPPYWTTATDFREAEMYQGGLPETVEIQNLSLLQEGTNVLAVQIHNSDFGSSDMSSNVFLSVAIKDDRRHYKPTPSWFDRIIFQSSLPLIMITTANNAEIVDDPKIDAHMGIINKGAGQSNFPNDPFTDYDGKIGIEIRGTSSQIFDKKGFDIETRNEDGSNNNVELLGMPEENDWILYGPYSDKSLLRNVLTYHLGQLTDQYAPRTRFCELFINEEYQGIYILTEEIKQDKNRIDIANLREEDISGDELTGGYIIKVDRNPDNTPGKGWYSTFPDNKFFAYVEPKAKDITEEQKAYIQQFMYFFEFAMNSNNYQQTYEQHIDLDSWVDYFLVTEISKHIDAYKLSFYMYKDKNSVDGKLHMGPLWDINLGYGNFDFECSPDPEGWAYEFPVCGSWHPFWARKVADIPNIQHLTNCRWHELREGPFNTENLLTYIDDQVDYLGTAIDRNYDRWPILGNYIWPNNFIGETYEDEVMFLKMWLIQRLEWMDENMIGDCEQLVNTDDDQYEDLNIEVTPNPSADYITLKNISSMSNDPIDIEIKNLQGQSVYNTKLTSNKNLIDIRFLPSGYYIVQIKAKNGNIHTQAFIKA